MFVIYLMYASICSLWHSASLCWHDELKSPCHGSCSSQCVSVPYLGPLAPRRAVGARHDGLPSSSVLSTPVGCVPWLECQRRICRSTPRCCRSSPFSACPFFDSLRLFPAISLWLGRPILSRAHTISVFVALQLS